MSNRSNSRGGDRRDRTASRPRPRAERPARATRSNRSDRSKNKSERRTERSSVSLPRSAVTRGKQAAKSKQGEALGANVHQSLEATSVGLQKFLASMQQSGMDEALSGYRNLQGVLLQQRRWADSNKHKDLMPVFRKIADSAAALHRIFAGYAAIMAPLKGIGRVLPPSDAEIRVAARSVDAVIGANRAGADSVCSEVEQPASTETQSADVSASDPDGGEAPEPAAATAAQPATAANEQATTDTVQTEDSAVDEHAPESS